LKNGKVNEIKVTSEAGGVLKLILPWQSGGSATSTSSGKKSLSSSIVEMQTVKGETIVFQP